MRAGELNRFWRSGLAILGPLLRLAFRIRVVGLEHVPSTGPAIFVFNHVSAIDGVVLGIEVGRRLRRETRFLVGSEFFDKSLVGWVLRHAEQIPLRRGEGDTKALDEALETIRRGALSGLAPEGRIDDAGGTQGLQRLRSGAARIALPTGAPIVPVGIWGTQARYPRSGFTMRRPWRPRLALAFGPPILPVGDVASRDDIRALTARIKLALEEQVTRARRMAGPPA